MAFLQLVQQTRVIDSGSVEGILLIRLLLLLLLCGECCVLL